MRGSRTQIASRANSCTNGKPDRVSCILSGTRSARITLKLDSLRNRRDGLLDRRKAPSPNPLHSSPASCLAKIGSAKAYRPIIWRIPGSSEAIHPLPAAFPSSLTQWKDMATPISSKRPHAGG